MGQSGIQALTDKLNSIHTDVIEFKVSNARLEEKLYNTSKTVNKLEERIDKLEGDTWDKYKFFVGLGAVILLQIVSFFI